MCAHLICYLYFLHIVNLVSLSGANALLCAQRFESQISREIQVNILGAHFAKNFLVSAKVALCIVKRKLFKLHLYSFCAHKIGLKFN